MITVTHRPGKLSEALRKFIGLYLYFVTREDSVNVKIERPIDSGLRTEGTMWGSE